MVLTGCIAPHLSPTTYRCSGSPEFPNVFNQITPETRDRLLPGVKPGMTREQVRAIFRELQHQIPEIATGVALDDSNPEFFDFLAGTCPHLRYVFKNDRLVATGRLGMEAGFWTYIGRSFTESRCEVSRTKIMGQYHWLRTSPKYDEHGHFIGLETIDDGPLAPGSLKAHVEARRKIERNHTWLNTEEKDDDPDYLPPGERNYCKGMKPPGP